jgi:hypothetical protein
MISLRNVKLSSLMLIMALVLSPLLFWPSSAAASTLPTVATAYDIGITTATLNGDMIASGGASITEYGFYYGTTPSCTIQQKVGNTINEGSSFCYKLTNLQAGTIYYYKAYAVNPAGTNYGSVNTFTTNENGDVPIVTTDSAASIGNNYATLNGEINSDENSPITSYGFYYGTSISPDTKVTVGSLINENQNFSYNLSNLNAGTAYYFKAYATNANGTTYGNILNFNVPPVTPVTPDATFTIGSPYYQVKGVNMIAKVTPFTMNSRTLLPVTDVAASLGMTDANIVWNAATQTITLTKGTTVVELVMGSNIISVNNTNYSMDVAPEVINGFNCLPLRWVAERFGEIVNWNGMTSTVTFQ